jgi:outer membrane protein assembly factor BamB
VYLKIREPGRLWGRRIDASSYHGANWAPSPPIPCRGRLVIAPSDTNRLLCFDARSGKRLWTSDKLPETHYLLGAFRDSVIVGGRELVGYAIDSGRVRWKQRLPAAPSGRGVVASPWVLVPAGNRITYLNAYDGRSSHDVDLEGVGRLGNLALARGALVAAGLESVIGVR